jgi:enterochelin esterase-like enzyme
MIAAKIIHPTSSLLLTSQRHWGVLVCQFSRDRQWDDFAVKELVPYIDANFRTLARSSSRAFIGGYGTLRLGIPNPDVFRTVYAMHPVGTGPGAEVFISRPD